MMVKCDENSEGIEEECEQVRLCVAKFGVEEVRMRTMRQVIPFRT